MHLFPPDSRLLLAVSGGPDSLVLLDILHHFQETLGVEMRICHVNHNLRGSESRADERFVIDLHERYDLPLTVRRFDIDEVEAVKQGNMEENARNLRYQKLIHTAIEFDYTHIVTGHTMSDQAETLLHRLLRSTGLTGLTGIHPVRRDLEIPVIRPLLCITREEVFQYLQAAELEFRTDSMNLDEQYTRVQIRKNLLPLLKSQFNPHLERSLSQLADFARDEEEFWQRHTAFRMQTCGEGTSDAPADRLYLNQLSTAEKRRLLRAYCMTFEHEPSAAQVEEMLDQLQGNKPQTELHLSRNLRFYRRYDGFLFASPHASVKEIPEFQIPIPGSVLLPEPGIEVTTTRQPVNLLTLKNQDSYTADFDAEKVVQPLILRTRLEGDTIHPLGLNGRKKVKKILQEKKIPLEERDRIPILCFGDEIAWVAGCCVSETFRVDKNTKDIIQIRITPIPRTRNEG
jgi:tRNA(Ile)-lysidine synthase